MTLTRRRFGALTLAALAPLPSMARAEAPLDSPEAMIAAARERAARSWTSPARPLLAPFDALDYDRHRAIRPLPGRAAALPLGDAFRADLLAPGWLFDVPLRIALPGHDTAFAPGMFSFDPAKFDLPDPLPDTPGMGFAGLRLLTPLNDPARWDEVLVLQGASYFRALARDTVYGLSARALALNTGGPGPEEFPVTEAISVFQAGDSLHLGCLIDSPRAAAALIARLHPGAVTRMECSLHLFPRERLADAGIAPLTSMFQHSAMGPARIDDFRPAVHDSDVLVIDNGAGERLWRPLANPATLQMSGFADRSPRGFGLLQSPTDFSAFRDAEARYHRRPSAWVRPQGDWGAGAVMLLEIPTMDEFADNIVAFWRPEAPLDPGEHRFDYDLDWLAPGAAHLPPDDLPLHPVAMASGVDPNTRTARLFVLDFAGAPGTPLPANLSADLAPAPGVRLHGQALYTLPEAPDTLRFSVLLTPDDGTDAAELRLTLRHPSGRPASPVWLHRWTRAAGGGV